MDYKIVNKDAFTVIANVKKFSYEGANENVPLFWKEHFESGKGAVVCGAYGVNIDETMGKETFEYMIADPYLPQREVPEGFETRTIPAFTWAVFPCVGPMPDALQMSTTRFIQNGFRQQKTMSLPPAIALSIMTTRQNMKKARSMKSTIAKSGFRLKRSNE